MQPLPHGYTNDTQGDGAVVVKQYQGPDAAERRLREYAILERLRGRLPVPPLLGEHDGGLRMGFVSGVQGQELIDAGFARPVLRAGGEVLREIHAEAFPDAPGTVLVHGDFGPNNLLLDPATFTVSAVLDWELAHPGDAVEDLAWCEWIVRMHHADQVAALDEFFDGYGHRPPWAERQAAMVAQCRMLLDMCRRWPGGGDAVRMWGHRLAVTAAWTE